MPKQHAFKEKLRGGDKSPAVEQRRTEATALIHKKVLELTWKSWIPWLTETSYELEMETGAFTTHPVCDSPNKHICCRTLPGLNSADNFSKFAISEMHELIVSS